LSSVFSYTKIGRITVTVNPKILVSFDSFRYVVQLEETGVTLMRKATRMLKFNQKR